MRSQNSPYSLGGELCPSVDFTVFAPTDAAFTALAAQLGFSSAGAVVEAMPKSALESILLDHVLPTRKTAADLVAGGATQPTLYTFGAAPSTLALNTSAGVVITDEVLTTATVVTADVRASNGIVHVIDKVLVPPGVLNIVQMAQVDPAFSTLVGAVVSADLAGTLSNPMVRLTVFAPTNDAFALIAPTVAGLSIPELTTVLTYHVLGSQVLAADIPFGTAVPTLATPRTITINAAPLTITDTTATPAQIDATDVRASNGVIHVISKVLIPLLPM